MSRSRRKTPITGNTTAESDKSFKQRAHRQARRKLKATDLTLDDAPGAKRFGNPWQAEKDGKAWFDADRFPDLMRK